MGINDVHVYEYIVTRMLSLQKFCFRSNNNKLRGRRVRPTRYTPARMQEPNFTAL